MIYSKLSLSFLFYFLIISTISTQDTVERINTLKEQKKSKKYQLYCNFEGEAIQSDLRYMIFETLDKLNLLKDKHKKNRTYKTERKIDGHVVYAITIGLNELDLLLNKDLLERYNHKKEYRKLKDLSSDLKSYLKDKEKEIKNNDKILLKTKKE